MSVVRAVGTLVAGAILGACVSIILTTVVAVLVVF